MNHSNKAPVTMRPFVSTFCKGLTQFDSHYGSKDNSTGQKLVAGGGVSVHTLGFIAFGE